MECAPLRSAHKYERIFLIEQSRSVCEDAPALHFHGRVVEKNGICSAAFCESAALWAAGSLPRGELSRSD